MKCVGRILCLLTDKVALLRGCGGFVDDDIIALKIKTHDEFYFFEFVLGGNQLSFETSDFLITAAAKRADGLYLDRIRFRMRCQITVQPER